MAQGNLEKFIVDLGFSDKNAVKGLKAFIAKVDKMKVSINASVTGLSGAATKVRGQSKGKVGSLLEAGSILGIDPNKELKAMGDFYRKLEETQAKAATKVRSKARGKPYDGKKSAADFTSSWFGFNLMQDSPEKFNQARQHLETFKGTTDQAKRYVNDLKNAERVLRKNNAHLKKGNMLQRGLSDSTRNMVRSYASVFALFSTASYINTSGQTMEGVVAGMTAVSKSSQEAESNLRFLREEGQRLGLDIGESSKAFVKLRAAIGDKATIEETRKAFTNLSEAGVVYQVSQADMAGTIRAVQQMFSKSGIMAEEFKTQLGDRIPTAMVALEKSTGKTAKELLKMMEMGQLGVEYINPFLTALGELANKNGALEKSLKTTATAQRQFNTELKLVGDTIYKEGFGEGFGDLLRDLIKHLKESKGGLEGLGKTFQAFFGVVRAFAAVAIPVFNALSTIIGKLSEGFTYVFGEGMGEKILQIVIAMGLLKKALWSVTTAAALFGKTIQASFWPIFAALAALQEIYTLFDSRTEGSFEKSTGKQGFAAVGAVINPFSEFRANSDRRLLEALSKPSVVVNPTPVVVNVDGVKKSVEGQMQIDYSQAMVGGR